MSNDEKLNIAVKIAQSYILLFLKEYMNPDEISNIEQLFQKNNKFQFDLTIDSNGKIIGKIFDLKNLEEYTNFRIKNFGSFSATVVEEYRKVLKSMLYKKIFVNDQANRIYKNIINSYHVNPEFL